MSAQGAGGAATEGLGQTFVRRFEPHRARACETSNTSIAIRSRPFVLQHEGELALATDYMVFNVTKDDIKVRMAAVEEAIWPQPSNIPLVPPDPAIRRTELSKKLLEGRVIHREVLQEVYDDINKRFGSNEKVPE